MAKLSYLEALYGVVNPEDMEGVIGIVDNHKNWGQFSVKIPSHIVVSLVEEVKRLREDKGGFKQIPEELGA